MKKQFLYIMQSEYAIDEKLEKQLITYNSDLILLIWSKIPPRDLKSYMMHYPCTWTDGRNKLMEACRHLPQKYEYYIFVEDDLIWEKGSFRDFEKLLFKYKPAIGIPYQKFIMDKPMVNQELRDINNEVCESYLFDAIINGYHKNVFFDDVIFPYVNIFDYVSIYYPQLIINHIAHVIYKGCTFTFKNLVVNNGRIGKHDARDTKWYVPELWLIRNYFTDEITYNVLPTRENNKNLSYTRFSLKNFNNILHKNSYRVRDSIKAKIFKENLSKLYKLKQSFTHYE